MQGLIESFAAEDPLLTSPRIEATGLDNGSHQMMIHDGCLYLQETYMQRIKIFPITETGALGTPRVVYPAGTNIANIHYALKNPSLTSNGYLHMNAITCQDGLFYISCPRLRDRTDERGQPSQQEAIPHSIMVFDRTFKPLWSMDIKEVCFCHDLVFLGSKVYFLSSSNVLLSYDIQTKLTRQEIVFPNTLSRGRGLSITKDGTCVVGFRFPSVVVVANLHTKTITSMTAIPDGPCMIWNTNLDQDYAHVNGPLRRSFVLNIPCPSFFAPMSSTLQELVSHVFQHKDTFTTRQDIHVRQSKLPPFDGWSNVEYRQPVSQSNISLVTKSDQAVHQLYKQVHDFGMSRAMYPSGRMFLYPPFHHLGWHTNLETVGNHNTYRCYLVYCTEDNKTFFLYRHPISHQIHAVPDRHGTANLFYFGNTERPLWHAVINPTPHVYRLSLGFAFKHSYQFPEWKDMLNELKYCQST